MNEDNKLGLFMMVFCFSIVLAFGAIIQYQAKAKPVEYLYIKNYTETPGRIDLTLNDNSTRLCHWWYFSSCRNNYNSLFVCDKSYCAPVAYSWSSQNGSAQ